MSDCAIIIFIIFSFVIILSTTGILTRNESSKALFRDEVLKRSSEQDPKAYMVKLSQLESNLQAILKESSRAATNSERNNAVFPRGANLGNYAELGCGPFTQTLHSLLSARPDLTFTNITLTDPNLSNYVRDVPGAPYLTGKLRLREGSPPPNEWGPVNLITAGAEEPIFNRELDTVLMTNVLEHVQDAYAVLHQLHRALRPGGVVIFSEHWWMILVILNKLKKIINFILFEYASLLLIFSSHILKKCMKALKTEFGKKKVV
jgi:SAM-dependent methyltransferase